MSDSHREIMSTWSTSDSRDFGYFERFERQDALDRFWSPSSRFRRCFDDWLDLTDTLEIACGVGRHAAQIADRCGTLSLIDTSPAAIALARQRFSGSANVTTVVSEDGLSLPFSSDAFSAIYSYDAMVHFELLTVAAYIQEIARVLRHGGRALVHHSNFGGNPGGRFDQNPSWRNFMPPGVVIHLADRNGLRVLQHQTFRWKNPWWSQKTDALTVLERP